MRENIIDYKGKLISQIPYDKFSYFVGYDGCESEEGFLILASTTQVPTSVNYQWILFYYNDVDYGPTDFRGCGIRLPVVKEMEAFVRLIAEDSLANFDLEYNREKAKESYSLFVNGHGLTWGSTNHILQHGACPLDATPENIKKLTGLNMSLNAIDPNNECNLSLFIIRQ